MKGHVGRGASRELERGFTLIELMIVMVVLGILAGLTSLSVGVFEEAASDAVCAADVDSVNTAVVAYMAANDGAEPGSIGDLVDAGFLREPPSSGVTLATTEAECESVAAGPSTSTSTTSTPTTPTTSTTSPTSTTSTTLPPTMHLGTLTGTTLRILTTNDWKATITVTVLDDNNVAMTGIEVSGNWDNGATPNSCTTNVLGTCSFVTDHTTSNPAIKRTWTATGLATSGGQASLVCGRHGAPAGVAVCS